MEKLKAHWILIGKHVVKEEIFAEDGKYFRQDKAGSYIVVPHLYRSEHLALAALAQSPKPPLQYRWYLIRQIGSFKIIKTQVRIRQNRAYFAGGGQVRFNLFTSEIDAIKVAAARCAEMW